MEKQTLYGRLREFYATNQFQMWMRGSKKSKKMADIIYAERARARNSQQHCSEVMSFESPNQLPRSVRPLEKS